MQQGGGHTGGPYKFFFPIGLGFAFWGALVWVLFAFGLGAYPGQLHANLMTGGFLFAFAAGFLLTAVPRFTGTSSARPGELALVGASFAVQILAGLGAFGAARQAQVLLLGMAFGLVSMAVFFARRWRARTNAPPPTFLFAGGGLVVGFAGAVLLAAAPAIGAPTAEALGRNLLYHAMVPSMVVGVGCRLFPLLMGWGGTPVVAAPGSGGKLLGIPSRLALAGVLFFSSFFVESLLSPVLGRILQAGVLLWIAVAVWRLHHLPPRRGQLAMWLWVAAWAFVGGYWGKALLPAYAIHFAHLTFIVGLGMTTFMVATRVTLAHGGHGTAAEIASRALLWTGVFLVASTLVRLAAGVVQAGYFHQIALAAALWIVGLLIWSIRFVPALVADAKVNPE